MRMQTEYEKELLEWKKQQFLLQKKYTNTPPGFRSGEQENAARERLEKEEREYLESCVAKIISQYQSTEEIFVGREDILRRIGEAFASKAGPVILYGMGGMGKSAIAREYLRRRNSDYDYVLLLYGDEGIFTVICDDCQVQISNMQYSKDKYGNRNNYFREKICALKQIIKGKKLLLVIDNWDKPADKGMDEVFSLGCDILVTTRMTPAAWGLDGGIPVSGFREAEEWKDFLKAYGKEAHSKEEERELTEYCRRVGGHPLLMKLKTREFEKTYHFSEAKDGCPSYTDETYVKYLKNLFTCYSLHKEETQALRELSVMPVQGISYSLYRMISDVSEAALRHLESCLLISSSGSEEDRMIFLHPMVAEAAKKLFSPTLTNCRHMVGAFCDSIWNAWNNTYIDNQKMKPYVFALLRAFPIPAAWMAGELEKISTWLWIQGYYEEAERWQKKIVNSVEKYYGENHQVTGEMALRMAAVYYNSLELEKADLWYRKAYGILKRCDPLDVRHRRLLATACNKLSRDYRSAGKIDLAAQYLEKADHYFQEYCELCGKSRNIRVQEESVGIIRASYKYYRARILAAQGRDEEAERLCKEVREDILAMEGEEIRVNEFDSLYIELLVKKGAFPAALTLAKEALDRSVLYRGAEFKDTLICMEQLGDVFLAAGCSEEAGEEYRALFLQVSRCFPRRKEWTERVNEKILMAETGDCRVSGPQFFRHMS